MSSKGKTFDEQVLEFILKHESVNDADVAREMPRSTTENRAYAFNALLNSQRIQLVGNDFDNPRYKALAPEEAVKIKGMSVEDLLVYQVISQSGNTGIWTRDMKQRTNLAQGKITKILKVLEERGLVKSVKSVQNASRKVYMLSTLEPAKEITGGPWYGADQQPDKEFIDTIRAVVQAYVEKHPSGYASVEEVAEKISSSGVSNQILQVEDVENILKTLVYDNVLDQFQREGDSSDPSNRLYGKSKLNVPKGIPFTDIPCGVCPVFNECHEGGQVAPEKCEYYKKWLEELVDF